MKTSEMDHRRRHLDITDIHMQLEDFDLVSMQPPWPQHPWEDACTMTSENGMTFSETEQAGLQDDTITETDASVDFLATGMRSRRNSEMFGTMRGSSQRSSSGPSTRRRYGPVVCPPACRALSAPSIQVGCLSAPFNTKTTKLGRRSLSPAPQPAPPPIPFKSLNLHPRGQLRTASFSRPSVGHASEPTKTPRLRRRATSVPSIYRGANLGRRPSFERTVQPDTAAIRSACLSAALQQLPFATPVTSLMEEESELCCDEELLSLGRCNTSVPPPGRSASQAQGCASPSHSIGPAITPALEMDTPELADTYEPISAIGHPDWPCVPSADLREDARTPSPPRCPNDLPQPVTSEHHGYSRYQSFGSLDMSELRPVSLIEEISQTLIRPVRRRKKPKRSSSATASQCKTNTQPRVSDDDFELSDTDEDSSSCLSNGVVYRDGGAIPSELASPCILPNDQPDELVFHNAGSVRPWHTMDGERPLEYGIPVEEQLQGQPVLNDLDTSTDFVRSHEIPDTSGYSPGPAFQSDVWVNCGITADTNAAASYSLHDPGALSPPTGLSLSSDLQQRWQTSQADLLDLDLVVTFLESRYGLTCDNNHFLWRFQQELVGRRTPTASSSPASVVGGGNAGCLAPVDIDTSLSTFDATEVAALNRSIENGPAEHHTIPTSGPCNPQSAVPAASDNRAATLRDVENTPTTEAEGQPALSLVDEHTEASQHPNNFDAPKKQVADHMSLPSQQQTAKCPMEEEQGCQEIGDLHQLLKQKAEKDDPRVQPISQDDPSAETEQPPTGSKGASGQEIQKTCCDSKITELQDISIAQPQSQSDIIMSAIIAGEPIRLGPLSTMMKRTPRPEPFTIKQMFQGAWFLKYGKRGKPMFRWLYLCDISYPSGPPPSDLSSTRALAWATEPGAPARKQFPITSFTAIALGANSAVFSRWQLPGKETLFRGANGEWHDGSLCFSVHTNRRSIDLKAGSAESFAVWTSGLLFLLETRTQLPYIFNDPQHCTPPSKDMGSSMP